MNAIDPEIVCIFSKSIAGFTKSFAGFTKSYFINT